MVGCLFKMEILLFVAITSTKIEICEPTVGDKLVAQREFGNTVCHQSVKWQSSTTQILKNSMDFSRSWRPEIDYC